MTMNTLTYKGYIARIDFDARDDIFVGRILGVRDIISFHADNTHELRHEFELAVDDYLADCAEQGISPEKPANGKIMLRVPPEVHAASLIAAQASGQSLNQWAAKALAAAAIG
ncbi:antitoxin HicB [Betaproteobacteria bacterium]|nr:antitoxin HicB [Betaproteobacteria bacterium]GHU01431.1 antitoxin HicB [Betaproteobacteria bacterium]GHU21951.1 antitoxin HicB [Betaproteobacteria bacterium]